MAHTNTTPTYTTHSTGYADARQTDCFGAEVHKVDGGYLIIATGTEEAQAIAADLKANGIAPLHPEA